MAELTQMQRTLLAIEQEWPQHCAAKEHAIAAQLDLTPVRFYLLLSRLAEQPEAIAADPLLTARIRRNTAPRLPILGKSAKHHAAHRVASNGAAELSARSI